jgi:phosphohistidine swiveling domain-containing protein
VSAATIKTSGPNGHAGPGAGRVLPPGQMMLNPLHYVASDPDVLWSPGNVSEAIPGVSTALNWSFIDDSIEAATRRAFHAMGLLSRAEMRLGTRTDDRCMVCFYGRTVANIERIRLIGDRLPGTSANALEEQLFGVVRPDAVNHPTLSRLVPFIARMPVIVARLVNLQARHRNQLTAWWRHAVTSPPADLDAGRLLLVQARKMHSRSFELSTLASMLAQSLYDQLVLLARAAGAPGLEHRLATGYTGLLETGMLSDLWDLAHGTSDITPFLLIHGYHCPGEGQMHSRVWREEPRPLLALTDRYARLGPGAHPRAAEPRQRAIREAAEAELLSRLGRFKAPGAKLVLRLARSLIPQREVGKANYTQSLDGGRVAARSIGRALVAQRVLDQPDDVFGLTYAELTGGPPPSDARALAAERTTIREDYLTTDLPGKWSGPPERVPLTAVGIEPAAEATEIRGEGAGGGQITARVRVVTDPACDDLEPGEILVCRTTDPSWASLFHLAAGVAVDMGGQISHGAIIARELGLPCVTCTVDASLRLHTGDLVSLDGTAGRIMVIEQAPADPNPTDQAR